MLKHNTLIITTKIVAKKQKIKNFQKKKHDCLLSVQLKSRKQVKFIIHKKKDSWARDVLIFR